MLKKVLTLIFAALLVTSIHGCSSSSSEEEQAPAQADSELDAVEGESVAEAPATAEGEAGLEDTAAADDVLADLGDGPTDEVKSDEVIDDGLSEDTTKTAEATPPPVEESKPTEVAPEPVTDTAATPSNNEDLFGGGSATPVVTNDAPKPMASLKKIKDVPYKQGKILANTVYLVRDGDTLESVSEKTGATPKDLKKVNSFLSRGVKVGDKIYYNSAKRPDDAERMLTYYEDNGMPEQIYTAKAGDDIKAVAQELFGNKDSWKELWATNSVESKGKLDEGTSLRYWPSGAAPVTQDMAMAEPPPTQELPPPPPQPDPAAMAAVAPPPQEPPPPPLPPQEPPPAMKPPKVAKKSDGFLIPGLGQDETFAVGGLGLLAILLGTVIIIKKNKSRRLSSQTQTQI